MNGIRLTRFGAIAAMTATAAWANVAPEVVIESVAMRAGTTYMDIVYRVEDPDDTTVAVRAAAFVDGVRSLEKLLKPVTFAEGTEANLGDAVTTNVSHTLTWNAGADWDVTLGQVKFEVLAKDGRALTPIDWITIPAVGSTPELTVSENAIADTAVWDALLWLYLSGDTGLNLEAGKLVATNASGAFSGLTLAAAGLPGTYGPVYLFKNLNLAPANFSTEIAYADTARRVTSPSGVWYAKNAPYAGTSIVAAWGPSDTAGQLSGMAGNLDIVKLVCGSTHAVALSSTGTVSMWGGGTSIFTIGEVPAGLDQVVDIATCPSMTFALKADGSLVAWGYNYESNIARPPVDLGPVKAVTLGGGTSGQFGAFAAAVKPDGTVVAWGTNLRQQTVVPAGLSNVKTVAAGGTYTIALKEDGTVVGWGFSANAAAFTPPAGLADVVAISTSPYTTSISNTYHSLAIKGDGTVVAWGSNTSGQCDVPPGLNNVVSVAAGVGYSLALKSDGTVVSWGANGLIPTNLTGVTSIAAGSGGLGYAVKSDTLAAE